MASPSKKRANTIWNSPNHTFHWSGGFLWPGVAHFVTKWPILVHYKVLRGWQCQILTLHIYHTPLVKARNILLGKAVKERSYGSDSWSRTRASLATALPPWTDYQVHFPDSLRCLLTIWREANNSHFGTLLNIPPIIFHHFPPYPNLNYVCRICQDS